MNVRFHIERLILHGLPLEEGQGPAVQAAVETELARLLAEHGLPASVRQGGALEAVRATDIALPAQAPRSAAPAAADAIGNRIAHAVHQSVRR